MTWYCSSRLARAAAATRYRRRRRGAGAPAPGRTAVEVVLLEHRHDRVDAFRSDLAKILRIEPMSGLRPGDDLICGKIGDVRQPARHDLCDYAERRFAVGGRDQDVAFLVGRDQWDRRHRQHARTPGLTILSLVMNAEMSATMSSTEKFAKA